MTSACCIPWSVAAHCYSNSISCCDLSNKECTFSYTPESTRKTKKSPASYICYSRNGVFKLAWTWIMPFGIWHVLLREPICPVLHETLFDIDFAVFYHFINISQMYGYIHFMSKQIFYVDFFTCSFWESLLERVSLSLFTSQVGINHYNASFPTDQLTTFTNFTNRDPYLHSRYSLTELRTYLLEENQFVEIFEQWLVSPWKECWKTT